MIPFAVVAWAVAILVACRWMAGAKREDESFTDKMP
jgi:hypothetical protein